MKLPKIGFGTYEIFNDLKTGVEKFYSALESGFTLIDTAEHYHNHIIIGKIISKIIIEREDLQIVTKLWRNSLDYKSVITKTNQFLNELQTDYIDCLLIHWPNEVYDILETLGALIELKQKGYIKSYGVSNFTFEDLKEPLDRGVKGIEFNQVEFSPLLNQNDLYSFCSKKHIQVMSYGSLANGKCLTNNTIIDIAKRNKISQAQVVYSWLLNKNIIPIVGLDTKEQILENIMSVHIKLPEKDIILLENINENYRTINPPFSTF